MSKKIRPSSSSILHPPAQQPMDEAYRRRSEELLQLILEDEQRLNEQEDLFDFSERDTAPMDTSPEPILDREQARQTSMSRELHRTILEDEERMQMQELNARLEMDAEDFERRLLGHQD